MISSARHSAMVLMLRKEASRAPVVRRYRAYRRRGGGMMMFADMAAEYY